MFKNFIITILSFLIANSTAKDLGRNERLIWTTKCIEGLECYYTGPPWHSLGRPVSLTPSDRDSINTQFLLFTRKNPKTYQTISTADLNAFKQSNFNKDHKIKLIIHGYFSHGEHEWVLEMKDRFLQLDDFNVISVQWKGGSRTTYFQAVSNIRVVGTEIAMLVKFMKENFGVKEENVHLIGHSLGAHAAGLAGARLNTLGRISALDPAEPYFQNEDIEVRLDPTDAQFVDVLHTDSSSLGLAIAIGEGGLGASQTMGHLDFYPNGGEYQPNCTKGIIESIDSHGLTEGLKEFFACSHGRAKELFIHSINAKCKFEAFECANWETFKKGACFKNCEQSATQPCGLMGYNANTTPRNKSRTEVKMFLATSGREPYCGQQFTMKLDIPKTEIFESERGNIEINVVDIGTDTITDILNFFSDTTVVNGGQSYYKACAPVTPFDYHQSILLRWKYQWKYPWEIWRTPSLPITRMTLTSFHDGKTTTFCGEKTEAPHDQWIKFNKQNDKIKC